MLPSKDNTLFQDSLGSQSNGAGQYLFSGATKQRSVRRALIAFDIAKAIPAGATITKVQLTLSMSKTISVPQSVALRRVLSDWGEGRSDASASEGAGATATTGDATWLHRTFNTAMWAKAGGDFADTASANLSVGGVGKYTWTSAQMAADVQQWLNNPASNFGWVLIGNEGSTATAKRFDSKENDTPANRPVLVVDYTTP